MSISSVNNPLAQQGAIGQQSAYNTRHSGTSDGQGIGLQKRIHTVPTPTNPGNGGGHMVTLSDQARALQQPDDGQSDDGALAGFNMAQQLLGSMSDKSLSLMGIANSDASKDKISFDSFSMEASSISAASLSQTSLTGSDGSQLLQQGIAIGNAQQLKLTGHGTITTADGKKYEFTAELEVDTLSLASAQSLSASGASSGSQSSAQGGGQNGSQNGAQSGQQQLDFGGTAAQLLSHLLSDMQSSGNSSNSGNGTPVALLHSPKDGQSAQVLPGSLKLSLNDGQGQPLGQIDWRSLLSSLQSFVDGIGNDGTQAIGTSAANPAAATAQASSNGPQVQPGA